MFRYKRFPSGKGYHNDFDFIPYRKQIVFQEPLPVLPLPPVYERIIIKVRYGIDYTIFISIEEHANWNWFIQELQNLSNLYESELKIRIFHNMKKLYEVYHHNQEQIDLRRPYFFDILRGRPELRLLRENIGGRFENEYKTNLEGHIWIRPFVSDLVKFFMGNETALNYSDPTNIRENMFESDDIYESLN